LVATAFELPPARRWEERAANNAPTGTESVDESAANANITSGSRATVTAPVRFLDETDVGKLGPRREGMADLGHKVRRQEARQIDGLACEE
jgi:hypothetical protein